MSVDISISHIICAGISINISNIISAGISIRSIRSRRYDRSLVATGTLVASRSEFFKICILMVTRV